MPLPELDTQVGGTNVPVGPRDLASPAAPPSTPSNIPPTAPNPMQGAQAPAPQPQPSAAPTQAQPSSQAPQEDSVDALFKKAGLGPQEQPAKEPEAPFLQRVRDTINEDIQKIEAKFKMGVARNPNEQKTALEQVFGADNIKFVDGKIKIRHEGQKGFKSWSPEAFTMFVNPIATLVGKAINEMPENAGRLAGMVTQGGIQAVGAVAGGVAGLSVGYPTVGAAIGGGIAGVLGSRASRLVNQGMNQLLGQEDPSYHHENSIATIGDAINNDWVQGALGAGMSAYGVHASVKAANNAELASRGLSDQAVDAVNKLNSGNGLTNEQQAFPKWVSALKSFKEMFFPVTETEGTKAGMSAGQEAIGVAEKNMSDLGANIGVLNDEAASLQKSKSTPSNPVYLKPDEFSQYTKQQLQKHGVEFTDEGFVDKDKTDLSVTAPSNVKLLMNANDEAAQAKLYSQEKGLSVEKTQLLLDTLANQADYERDHPSSNSSEQLFRGARDALSTDRVTHYNQLFNGEDSVESQLFKQTMGEYSQKKASLDIIRKQFNDPGKIELFAKKLTAAGSPTALNGLDAFKHILGEDSPQWSNLKSELVGNILETGYQGDKINASTVNGFLSNKDNKPFLNRMFGDDQKPVNVLKSIVSQGEQLQSSNDLSSTAKAAMKMFVNFSAEHIPYGKSFVSAVSKLTGNNAASINYASEALLDAVKTASSSEQKDAMLGQLKELNQFKAGAKIVEAPMKVGDTTKYIRKYLPVSAIAATTKNEHASMDPTALPAAQSNNDKLNEIMNQPSSSQP